MALLLISRAVTRNTRVRPTITPTFGLIQQQAYPGTAVSYTSALKVKQMVLYEETGSPSAFEEDHFIPLELGGAPRNPKNLWPEPRSQSKLSDPLETQLKRNVSGGRHEAQQSATLIESFFNDAGRKGWEFVGITGTDKDHYALFKRRRRAGVTATEESASESPDEALPTPEERKRNREELEVPDTGLT